MLWVLFSLRSHHETTCPCQSWVSCPCPSGATQHLHHAEPERPSPHVSPPPPSSPPWLCCKEETHTCYIPPWGPNTAASRGFGETTVSCDCPSCWNETRIAGIWGRGDLMKSRHQAAVNTAFPSDDEGGVLPWRHRTSQTTP